MIITVFGATGKVGMRIVRAALANGHHVRAFGRNVESLIDKDLQLENFEAVKGYVFDEEKVLKAVKGAAAVISALGGGIDGTDKTRSLGMKNIIMQMEKAGVKRIISVAGMGLLKDESHEYIMDRPEYPAVFAAVSNEHRQAYLYLMDSGLDWTVICPPDIKDEDATGNYLVSTDYTPTPFKNKITAGDIADCMINALSTNNFIRKRVGICEA